MTYFFTSDSLVLYPTHPSTFYAPSAVLPYRLDKKCLLRALLSNVSPNFKMTTHLLLLPCFGH
jgi:hypothetical protein